MPNVMQQLFVMNIESLLKEYAAYRAFNKSDCVINMRIPHRILERIKYLLFFFRCLISKTIKKIKTLLKKENRPLGGFKFEFRFTNCSTPDNQ